MTAADLSKPLIASPSASCPANEAPPHPASSVMQFGALLKKNFRLKKRKPCGFCIEIFLPVVFVLALVMGYQAADVKDNAGKNFLTEYEPALSLDTISTVFCGRDTKAIGIFGACPAGLDVDVHCLNTNRAPLGNTICVRNLADASAALRLATNFSQVKRVPTLDQIIMLQWVGQKLLPLGKNYGGNGGAGSADTTPAIMLSGKLLFSPNTPETQNLVQYLNTSTDLFPYVYGGVFDSFDTARAYSKDLANEDTIWGAVNVDAFSDTLNEVTIALNRSSTPDTSFVRGFFSGGLAGSYYELYMLNGFVALQTAIESYFISQKTSGGTLPNPTAVVPMPYSPYTDSTFLVITGAISPLVLTMAFLFSVSQLTKRLVEEKEQRLREGMLIMGLGKLQIMGSWWVTYGLAQLLAALIIAIMCKGTMLHRSDVTLVFVLFTLFGLSSMAFACLLSSFFSKSRTAGMVAPSIFFLSAIPTFAIDPAASTKGLQIVLSLLAPSAFSQGTNLLFDYEQTTGMGWGDVASPVDSENGINMATSMFFLIFDTVWYLVLSLYLDAVLPSQWGTPKHPLFFLPCFWSKKSDATAATSQFEQVHRDGLAESYPEHLSESVSINSFRKEFGAAEGTKVAVDNFELKMFPGQVTVLLGHNGAGKTTTINMLIGMLPLTSGDATVYGESVQNNLNAVRQKIGLCPQHNILWPTLSVREHLEFFAEVKGLRGVEKDVAVKRMIAEVDLEEKTETLAGNLSGGQKRKLSVGIAFIGDSEFILLDEPTAGMDVGARRHTWELIQRMTKGTQRTVLMCTHFMDEADVLGQRIAIMSKGRLYCYGTSAFLKSRLGTGYTLRITSLPPTQIGDKKHHGQNQEIVAHGGSSNMLALIMKHVPEASLVDEKGTDAMYRLPMGAVAQFPPLLRYIDANKEALHISCYGISVSTLEDVFLRVARDEELGETAVDTPAMSPFKRAKHGDAHSLDVSFNVAVAPASSSTQIAALMRKRFNVARRDRRTLCLQIVFPVVCICLSMLFTEMGPPERARRVLDLSMYDGQPNILTRARCDSLNPHFYGGYGLQNVANASWSGNVSSFLEDTLLEHGMAERFVGLVCDDPFYGPPNTAMLFLNGTAWHALPQLVAEYFSAFYRRERNDNGAAIRVASFPLPFTTRQEARIEGVRALIIGFIILIPFTFIPSTFVAYVVRERESHAKHLQFISGVGFGAYWVSNLVFDFACFLITEFLAIIILAIFQRDEYIGAGEPAGAFFLLLTLYGISAVGGSYAVSFLFKTHGSAQNTVMIVNFLCGFVLVIAVYLLELFDSTKDVADGVRFLFRIVPSYCLGEGILALSNIPLQAQLGKNQSPFDLDVTGFPMIYLAIETPLFFLIAMFLDHPKRALRQQQLQQSLMQEHTPDVIVEEDADVVQERTEVETGLGRAGDVVRVSNLCKMYQQQGKPFTAVKNLSFGVKKGEVFGFLGTNGAGKTSCISILCGEFLPTRGVASVAGHDVVADAEAARQCVGYCPQFDAIIDLMTPAEHIRLFSVLRGIAPTDIDAVCSELLSLCGLEGQENVPSKRLSGGNKRKLSVALALIGHPAIVILDEPSAGMDPVARRDLWTVLAFAAKQCSIVLTTHHLEEVEALADRVCIMDHGEMKCIGSLPHLKNKFGAGYEVALTTDSLDAIPTTKEFIAKHFPSSVLQEENDRKLRFMVPVVDTTLAQLFEVLSVNQAAARIQEYTASQSSLEQVFLRFQSDEAPALGPDGQGPQKPPNPFSPSGSLTGYQTFTNTSFNDSLSVPPPGRPGNLRPVSNDEEMANIL